MIWDRVTSASTTAAHYSVFRLSDTSLGMDALRAMFPAGSADGMNFVLFSTSGVHGSYSTIEDVERDGGTLTFLIVQPRLVCLRYGECEPKTDDDFAFLKKLRASSLEQVAKIGFDWGKS